MGGLALHNVTPTTCFFAILFGLVLGSFSTALIYRIPLGMSLMTRSQCPRCTETIPARFNIPIIGFLVLKGKCQKCHNKIPWMYPIIELTSAALFLFIFLFTNNSEIWLLWIIFLITAAPLFVIDIQHHRLPDALTLSSGLLVFSAIMYECWLHSHFDRALPSFLGGFGLAAFYLTIAIISRGGMGMGDVKLSVSIGALSGFFGIHTILASTFSAFILGSAVGMLLMLFGKAGRKTALPFGPFMIVGQLIALILAATN
jgi:leader peptidase (prepilin peptidase)/N-methyltransferase